MKQILKKGICLLKGHKFKKIIFGAGLETDQAASQCFNCGKLTDGYLDRFVAVIETIEEMEAYCTLYKDNSGCPEFIINMPLKELTEHSIPIRVGCCFKFSIRKQGRKEITECEYIPRKFPSQEIIDAELKRIKDAFE